jgi:hypothetical protein
MIYDANARTDVRSQWFSLLSKSSHVYSGWSGFGQVLTAEPFTQTHHLPARSFPSPFKSLIARAKAPDLSRLQTV